MMAPWHRAVLAARIAVIEELLPSTPSVFPMRTRTLIPALLALPFMTSCIPTGRAYVGAAFMKVAGDVALQNAGGSLNLDASQSDIEDDLGAGGSDSSPYARAEADWGPHRVRVSGFGHSSGGTGTLTNAYGDLAASTAVGTDLEIINVTGAYTFDLLPTSMFRLGIGAQLGYSSIDLTVRQPSGIGFERVRTDNYVPMPVVDAEVDLGVVAFGGSLGGFEVDLGDADGRYWDGELFVRAAPWSLVELIGGYRYLSFDSSGEADNRDFNADLELTGWFIGGGIKF